MDLAIEELSEGWFSDWKGFVLDKVSCFEGVLSSSNTGFYAPILSLEGFNSIFPKIFSPPLLILLLGGRSNI